MVLSPESSNTIVAICVCLIEHYHQRCLRTILNIQYIRVTSLLTPRCLKWLWVTTIQLRWAGHVTRIEDHRLPIVILYGELSTGHRDKAAPRKRYKVKDTLKRSLATCNIDYRQSNELATHSLPGYHFL